MASRICRLSFHRLHHQFNVWPDGCAGTDSLGKTPRDDADFDLAHDHGPSDLAGRRCVMNESPQNASRPAAQQNVKNSTQLRLARSPCATTTRIPAPESR